MNTTINRGERTDAERNDFNDEKAPKVKTADEELTGEALKSQTEDEAEEKESFEKSKAEVAKLYEQRDKEMDKLISIVKKDIGFSEEGVRKAVKGIDGIVKILYSDRHDLSQEQQDAKNVIREIEKEIDKSEYDMLRISEGEPLDMNKPKEDIEKYTAEIEGAVEVSDDAREEFVDMFIEKNIKGIKEKFSNSFRGALNWKNAKDIIGYKIEREVGFAAKEFLKTGKNADFGFDASMEVSSYSAKEGGLTVDKNFITEFTMKFKGYERVIRAYDKPQGASLMVESARDQMGNIKRSGDGDVVNKKVDL